ncbi:MAG: hypothetical protein CSA81_13720 [Acidobacteria bacterium]|nr:MAG: hypothetical protein CSA81_13720 [Acidobacteriota bacterium]
MRKIFLVFILLITGYFTAFAADFSISGGFVYNIYNQKDATNTPTTGNADLKVLAPGGLINFSIYFSNHFGIYVEEAALFPNRMTVTTATTEISRSFSDLGIKAWSLYFSPGAAFRFPLKYAPITFEATIGPTFGLYLMTSNTYNSSIDFFYGIAVTPSVSVFFAKFMFLKLGSHFDYHYACYEESKNTSGFEFVDDFSAYSIAPFISFGFHW